MGASLVGHVLLMTCMSLLSKASHEGTSPEPCRDLIPNCSSFGASACRGSHSVWALENCRLYCGLCRTEFCVNTNGSCEGVPPTSCHARDPRTGQPYHVVCPRTCNTCYDLTHCRDALTSCARLDDVICTDMRTQHWARRNCAAKCGHCPKPTTAPTPTVNPSDHNSLLHGSSTPPSPPRGTSPEPCRDLIPNCSSFGASACLGSHSVWALENCRLYCGLCHTEHPGCRDSTSKCAILDHVICTDNRTRDWARRNCPVTCGFCGKPTSAHASGASSVPPNSVPNHVTSTTPSPPRGTSPEPCRDLIPNCSSFGASACLGSHSVWALENCRLYCGLCHTGPQLPTAVECRYEGMSFAAGEKWSIGCNITCVCENASSGVYRCSDRCPRYDAVPASCKMVQNPKDFCCMVPQCTNPATTVSAPLANRSRLFNSTSIICRDAHDRCATLDDVICSDNRTVAWARSNCARKCGFCSTPVPPLRAQQTSRPSGSTLTPPPRTMSFPLPTTPSTQTGDIPPCKDSIDNCATYGTKACVSHPEWSLDNCRRYCGFCAECRVSGRTLQQGEVYVDSSCLRYHCQDACSATYSLSHLCPVLANTSVPSSCYIAKRDAGISGTCRCQTVFCRHSNGSYLDALSSPTLKTAFHVHTLDIGTVSYTRNPLPADYIAKGGSLCD